MTHGHYFEVTDPSQLQRGTVYFKGEQPCQVKNARGTVYSA